MCGKTSPGSGRSALSSKGASESPLTSVNRAHGDWMGSMVPVPETATVMSCIAAV